MKKALPEATHFNSDYHSNKWRPRVNGSMTNRSLENGLRQRSLLEAGLMKGILL